MHFENDFIQMESLIRCVGTTCRRLIPDTTKKTPPAMGCKNDFGLRYGHNNTLHYEDLNSVSLVRYCNDCQNEEDDKCAWQACCFDDNRKLVAAQFT